MDVAEIEDECERGQRLLMEMQYLEAEAVLAAAATHAEQIADWELLSRLYLPLQEARRQRRQRCGEGTVQLDLIARSQDDLIDPAQIIQQTPQGQLLIAGWGTIGPAIELRRLAREHGVYVEAFPGAIFPLEAGHALAISPLETDLLPPPIPRSVESLRSLLPDNAFLLNIDELPRGRRAGTFETYAQTMALWERIHSPFLAAAKAETDPMGKIHRCRTTIETDYACEIAHQMLSNAARDLGRHL